MHGALVVFHEIEPCAVELKICLAALNVLDKKSTKMAAIETK